jgi:hypothetical protein
MRAWLAAALVLASCQSTDVTSRQAVVSASAVPSASQAVAPPSEPEVILLRAYSFPFSDDEERTESGTPNLVLYSDGVLVADTNDVYGRPADWASATISVDEVASIRDWLDRASLDTVEIDVSNASEAGAFDAWSTILQVRLDDRETVELVGHGLMTRLAAGDAFPPQVVELDQLLNGLEDRVSGETEAPSGYDIPSVRVAPDLTIIEPQGSSGSP